MIKPETPEEIKAEIEKFDSIREDFLDFIDSKIGKKDNGAVMDFENAESMSAEDVYRHFFKLDYQARKLRAYILKSLAQKAD